MTKQEVMVLESPATASGPLPPTLPAAPAPPVDPVMALLSAAVDKGVPVETMEKLVALHERMTAVSAAKQFNEALAAFQAACPPIPKSKTARITPKSGATYEYDYAPLEVIVPLIREPARANGLSFTWDTEVTSEAKLKVICRVRHVAGHEEHSAVEIPLATPSGMTDQQKVANARTFGMRLSLCSALGLVAGEAPDTDGGDANPQRVNEEQADALQEKADEVGADKAAFLRWLKVERFADIRLIDYTAAMHALERIGRQKAREEQP